MPPTSESKRASPSVTISRPARSWSRMNVPTASVYCSRKRASAMASRNARWPMFSVYHAGRGSDPVIVVGSVRESVVLIMSDLKFYFEERDGKSRLRGARRDGQSDGGAPDDEGSQGDRIQPHEVEGGVADRERHDVGGVAESGVSGG